MRFHSALARDCEIITTGSSSEGKHEKCLWNPELYKNELKNIKYKKKMKEKIKQKIIIMKACFNWNNFLTKTKWIHAPGSFIKDKDALTFRVSSSRQRFI